MADDENRKFRLAARPAFAVDLAEHHAQGPHLRPREAVAEMLEQLTIAQRDAGFGRRDEMGANLVAIRERLGHLRALANYCRRAARGRRCRRLAVARGGLGSGRRRPPLSLRRQKRARPWWRGKL